MHTYGRSIASLTCPNHFRSHVLHCACNSIVTWSYHMFFGFTLIPSSHSPPSYTNHLHHLHTHHHQNLHIHVYHLHTDHHYHLHCFTHTISPSSITNTIFITFHHTHNLPSHKHNLLHTHTHSPGFHLGGGREGGCPPWNLFAPHPPWKLYY